MLTDPHRKSRIAMSTRLRIRKLSAAALATLLLGGCGDSSGPLSAAPPTGGGGGGGTPPPLGAKKLTVVVAVVDSLMPLEITASTPNLTALTRLAAAK